jgi:hypothetical protein
LHWFSLLQKLALHVHATQPAADHEAPAGRRPWLHAEHTVSPKEEHAWVWTKPGPHTLHGTHLASAVALHGWRKVNDPLVHVRCEHWMQVSPEANADATHFFPHDLGSSCTVPLEMNTEFSGKTHGRQLRHTLKSPEYPW